MKPYRLFAAIAFLLFTVTINQKSFALPGKFALGYNEGWFADHYGSGLTSNFNADYVDEVMRGVKSAGGNVIRLWLFEGQQGLQMTTYAPQIQGVDKKMLDNISKVFSIARKHKVSVYLTLFDGNEVPRWGGGALRDFFYNLLNNKYGEADAFRKNVLKPLLSVMNKNRDIIYGLDLMNEIEAAIMRFYWPDSWAGPRQWIYDMRRYIKSQSSWLKVTSSSGWNLSYKNIPSGLFSGLGLDFYDIHLYADNGLEMLSLRRICDKAQEDKVPVILGEFGQLSKRTSDSLQVSSTKMFLEAVADSCLSGALAWRFDRSEKWWNFQRPDGSFRPAVQLMRDFKGFIESKSR